jgi:hypothetical protein
MRFFALKALQKKQTKTYTLYLMIYQNITDYENENTFCAVKCNALQRCWPNGPGWQPMADRWQQPDRKQASVPTITLLLDLEQMASREPG